ncbi:Lrp/AsnC family transcriptional regulator [Pararhodobacter oceanensis]|uniref:Lrp/AsnC family transcriptional regulator n=1 Tax=Pararhodobacter oceanensis TaxID=2172121 RepID=UPI003A8EA74E
MPPDTPLDPLDHALITALKRDGRASLSDLALQLNVTRTTVRTRLSKLIASGEIAGFTALTKGDLADSPVRALMMVAITGTGTDRTVSRILTMAPVQAAHATNGQWDVIVELATDSLETLDKTLTRIRRLEGVSHSETHLLMSTRRAQPTR